MGNGDSVEGASMLSKSSSISLSVGSSVLAMAVGVEADLFL